MPLAAEEHYSVQPPAFVWAGRARLGPLPVARARDMYAGGQGRLLVKAASLWPVVDASGEQMNQGEMILYLNEMMWFPAALLAGARSVIGSSRSSRCLRCSRRPRRSRCKAGEGLGSLGRVDFGQSCRCFGAHVGSNLSSATMLRKASAPRAGSS
jgi:hypothetical protein